MMQATALPGFIYGIAWKNDATNALVKMAVSTGFTAIDTANQPKHYAESCVGTALVELYATGMKREQLFLQTKFTPADGHDDNIPYDPDSDYATQVATSFQSSLQHLHTDYVDCYLLHGPYVGIGLSQADWEVWGAIEKLYATGQTTLIGISNVNLQQLILLTETARVKPMVVQNRCFANRGWDKGVREFCQVHHIMYQGFSLLTANEAILHSKTVAEIAQRLAKTPAQIIFKFAMQVGIVPLTGTISVQHMQQDLHSSEIELTTEDIASLLALSG